MNVVIVDDEINAVEYLVSKLKKYETMSIKATFTDACEAFAYLLKNSCDVLFLDIEMPNISGIYIAEQIISIYPTIKICFVTAYDEFAIKAFELSAIDYILKPYTDERLQKCLNRLSLSSVDGESFHQLSDQYKYSLDMICGYDDENIVLINYNDIFYIEAIQGDLLIHTKQNLYRGNKPLNFYEKKLENKSFFRTHKSFLVNLTKVAKFKPCISYTYNMYFREIEDSIPVSRSKVKELKLYLNQ